MVIEVRLKLLFAKRVVIRVTWTERIARSCCFEGCDRCSCRCWSRSNHDEIILKCQHLEQLPECPYCLDGSVGSAYDVASIVSVAVSFLEMQWRQTTMMWLQDWTKPHSPSRQRRMQYCSYRSLRRVLDRILCCFQSNAPHLGQLCRFYPRLSH